MRDTTSSYGNAVAAPSFVDDTEVTGEIDLDDNSLRFTGEVGEDFLMFCRARAHELLTGLKGSDSNKQHSKIAEQIFEGDSNIILLGQPKDPDLQSKIHRTAILAFYRIFLAKKMQSELGAGWQLYERSFRVLFDRPIPGDWTLFDFEDFIVRQAKQPGVLPDGFVGVRH